MTTRRNGEKPRQDSMHGGYDSSTSSKRGSAVDTLIEGLEANHLSGDEFPNRRPSSPADNVPVAGNQPAVSKVNII